MMLRRNLSKNYKIPRKINEERLSLKENDQYLLLLVTSNVSNSGEKALLGGLGPL